MDRKTAIFLLGFLCVNTFAQTLTNGQGSIVNSYFEGCASDCTTNTPVTCAKFDNITNEEGGGYTPDEPYYIENYIVKFIDCITLPPVPDPTPLGIALCAFDIRDNFNFGAMRCYAQDLIPNNTYQISFLGKNLGQQFLNNPGSPETDAKFVVEIDDGLATPLEFETPTMYFVPGSAFSSYTINFISTTPNAIITIKAISNGNDLITMTTLGLDNFKILDLGGTNPQGPGTDPTDDPTDQDACADCTSFKLVPGTKYAIGGWVKQIPMSGGYTEVSSMTYSDSAIKVAFTGANPTDFTFLPEGGIIDGWQRITGVFEIPAGADEIFIELLNNSINRALYDDIRVHPLKGSLKSFVYDQGTQKLMAELDENNYATFYEYDKEGGLVRVKKETKKGVFTIQETRSSNPKQ